MRNVDAGAHSAADEATPKRSKISAVVSPLPGAHRCVEPP